MLVNVPTPLTARFAPETLNLYPWPPQGFYEVFAEAESMSELSLQLRALPPAVLAPYRTASWKVPSALKPKL